MTRQHPVGPGCLTDEIKMFIAMVALWMGYCFLKIGCHHSCK